MKFQLTLLLMLYENKFYLNIGKPQVIFMQCSNINRSKKSKKDGNNSTNS